MARITHVSALTLVAACWLSAVACSSSNEPASTNGASGATSTVGGTGAVVPPAGGTGGTASTAGGSTSIAGTSGTLGGTTGAGGSTSTAGTSTGGTGTAGTGTGGGTGSTFTPLCAGLTTAAIGSPAPTKAGPCTATDPQLCWKTCGPNSVGFKSETCTNGAYVEQTGCSFAPDLDATCYKIPATIDAACPTTPPQASMLCTVSTCTLCNVAGNYLDSMGMSKTGYCVCPAPSAAGTSKWSCASATAWPCPAGMGC